MTASSMWPDWLKVGLLDPRGPVAAAEHLMLLNATVIMLAVIVPVIVLTLAVAWWFRAGNARAKRRENWSYSGPLEVLVWSIPLLVILFLGGMAWIGSHDLDPKKALASDQEPLDIQVISLDWKWLFLYPEEGVATVNHLVVPAARPLRLHLTSATVMNSFFVPQLGSQIYTMAGMATQLNLLADKPGTFPGLSAQFSGWGFSDMRFSVDAMDAQKFAGWIQEKKSSAEVLDASTYESLSRSGTHAPAVYRLDYPGLFETVVRGDGQRGMAMRSISGSASNSAVTDRGNICSAN